MVDKYQFLYEVPHDKREDDYCHNSNIVKCAASIIKKLVIHEEVVTVAEMQSGKTEVMKRLIYLIDTYTNKINKLKVNIDKKNIYLILCTSSINLKKQLDIKLPELKNRIYHLNDLYIFIKDSYRYRILFELMASSSLIIFDECHCDVEHKKLIDKFRTILRKIANNKNTTYYKIGFSATPYEQIIAGYPKIVMKPGKNYYGVKQMFETCKSSTNNNLVPIIFQAKNLVNKTECRNLFTEIIISNYYYIFRLPGNKIFEDTVINNLENQFKKNGYKFDTYIYDMNYKTNINELLKDQPSKPTIIYLKNKLRMGEYLDTTFVYLVHDDPNNMHTHTTAQSLVGRCCGYNKKSDQTIIYCDYKKAYDHYKWIVHNYDVKYIPPDAKYIDKKNNDTKTICIY